MIGIIAQLVISWLIVWFFEKGDLSCLGWRPTKKRLLQFVLFFFVSAACATLGFLLRMYIAEERWMINPVADAALILKGVWFTLKSVLFEELIFRGVLLYILIKKAGVGKAIIISGITFGIYHWFSHELWGNPQMMVIEFVVTGAMGLILAYGYSKSYSLYIPVAIHLGWNIVQMVIFSGNTIGNQLFVEVLPKPIITVSYFSFFVMMLMPLVCCLVFNFILLRRYKQESIPE